MSNILSEMNSYVLIAAALGVAFTAVLWISLVVWTYRDARSRTRDPLARILAVLVVTALFLPGLLIYLLLRPARTLEEEYQRTLEEETLLQVVEDAALCPGCSRRVQPDWLVCPGCHTLLKKTCAKCGRLLELPWDICPYCATPVHGGEKENLSLDEVLQSLPGE
ncbi:MAG TPA: zinc ribbon domain-containing protein [Chloroflexi bacterium]|nr:zinc ribbon domain-containing protein [Chloroflexota bacterium]HPO57946.1 zinc ribbon domain-containing protein [Anaerolineaceae bacterium]